MLKIFDKCASITKCRKSVIGTWPSPASRCKKFTSSSSDLILSWNYVRGLVSLQGRTDDRLSELPIDICKSNKSTANPGSNTTCENASNTCNRQLRIYMFSFVETLRKFIIAELSIRKLGSSSVLIIMYY